MEGAYQINKGTKKEKMRYWSNKRIDELTEQRLMEYSKKFEEIIHPPIPIDKIIENLFDLKISWEQIREYPGEIILGGLRPANREIILNEKHLDLFKEKPGLERSTKGHELGHWDLYIDESVLNHPLLPGFSTESNVLHRKGTKGFVQVMTNAFTDKETYSVYREYLNNKDEPSERRAVNRYASSLSLPRKMIFEISSKYDLTKWPSLYELAEIFDVTISGITVRLQQLGQIYIYSKEKICRSKDEFIGQKSLFSNKTG